MNIPIGFSGLGINPQILAILAKMQFSEPTPIQTKSIPVMLERKDMIGVAQTGTGKTLAFGVPLLQLSTHPGQKLVVLPTRELALQVYEVLEKIGKPLKVISAVIIGGESMYRQLQALKRQPQIIIGTPGRIVDHLEQKTLSFSRIDTVVLDEADRMLDMGFAPQLKRILSVVPTQRQTVLFSATMPENIVKIARQYMQLPIRVEIAQQGTPAERVSQELFFVDKPHKQLLLEKLLKQYQGTILLFSRTKHGARKLNQLIKKWGHSSAEIHSNRTLAQRTKALQGFKTGQYRILVATDIAARGIDVKNIEVVINYDLPDTPSDYVHRIGRTGRAGVAGHAITLATPEQKSDVLAIERLIRGTLPRAKHPEVPIATVAATPPAPVFNKPFTANKNRPPQFGRNSRRRSAPYRGGNDRKEQGHWGGQSFNKNHHTHQEGNRGQA